MNKVRTLLTELGEAFREEQEKHRNFKFDLFSCDHVVHIRVHHVRAASSYYKQVDLKADELTAAKHLAAALNEFRAVCVGYALKEAV